MLSNVTLWAVCRPMLIATAILGGIVPNLSEPRIGDRDKTGTSGCENGTKNPQACIFTGSAGMAVKQAERGGFVSIYFRYLPLYLRLRHKS